MLEKKNWKFITWTTVKFKGWRTSKSTRAFFFQYHCFRGPEWISTPKFCRLPAVEAWIYITLWTSAGFEHTAWKDRSVTCRSLLAMHQPRLSPQEYIVLFISPRHTWLPWTVMAHEDLAIMQSLLLHSAKTLLQQSRSHNRSFRETHQTKRKFCFLTECSSNDPQQTELSIKNSHLIIILSYKAFT